MSIQWNAFLCGAGVPARTACSGSFTAARVLSAALVRLSSRRPRNTLCGVRTHSDTHTPTGWGAAAAMELGCAVYGMKTRLPDVAQLGVVVRHEPRLLDVAQLGVVVRHALAPEFGSRSNSRGEALQRLLPNLAADRTAGVEALLAAVAVSG